MLPKSLVFPMVIIPFAFVLESTDIKDSYFTFFKYFWKKDPW